MADKGLAENDYAAIARVTNDERKNVGRWISGNTDTLPAEFVARLEGAGFVSASWLLTGIGDPEPRPPGDAEMRIALIRRVLDAEPATFSEGSRLQKRLARIAEARGEDLVRDEGNPDET